MKLANAPGRKLERQRGALARFRKGPSQASQPRDNPLIATSRRRPAVNPITEVTRLAEYARLSELCAADMNYARGHRTKKSRAHLATLRGA